MYICSYINSIFLRILLQNVECCLKLLFCITKNFEPKKGVILKLEILFEELKTNILTEKLTAFVIEEKGYRELLRENQYY